MGNPHFSIGNTSSKGPFSITMLVYRCVYSIPCLNVAICETPMANLAWRHPSTAVASLRRGVSVRPNGENPSKLCSIPLWRGLLISGICFPSPSKWMYMYISDIYQDDISWRGDQPWYSCNPIPSWYHSHLRLPVSKPVQSPGMPAWKLNIMLFSCNQEAYQIQIIYHTW